MQVGTFKVSNIKIARENSGLSLRQMERDTGLSYGLVSMIETGKCKATKKSREALRRVLGDGNFFDADGTVIMSDFVTYKVAQA